MTKACKTCNFWEPFNAVCFNSFSNERGDFTDRNFNCKHWQPHECPHCNGALEAKEARHKIWYECACGHKSEYDPTDMSAGRDVSACGVFVDRNLIGELVDSNGNVHYEDIMALPVLSCSSCEHCLTKWIVDKRYKNGGYQIIGCNQFSDAETEFDYGMPYAFCSLWKPKSK